ncbi:RraA family protein [candidate division KSB1 bacterium]|nr:RraA family protein [candidate division KSB1 bacterium]
MDARYRVASLHKFARNPLYKPLYTAVFYDPIDIALQRPDNEPCDQRHDRIRDSLLARNIRHARELFLTPEIRLHNANTGIVFHSAFTIELETTDGSDKTGRDQLEDILTEFEAIRQAKGCVLVVHNSAPADSPSAFAAVWGGIMGNSTAALGAVGVITDGFVRDSAQLYELAQRDNYLVFSRGACPLDARGHLQIKAYLQPISMLGVPFRSERPHRVVIHPGDLVVADSDGVICIPQDIAQDVIDLSIERHLAEGDVISGIRRQSRDQVIPHIRKHGIL